MLSYIRNTILFLTLIAIGHIGYAQDDFFCDANILPENPSNELLLKFQTFEKKYHNSIKSQSFQSRSSQYTLPVVFHIIHNGGTENLSDNQVTTGLNHLNDAFRNLGYYDDQVGEDVEVQFCLAQRDPDNVSTTGINHIQSPLTNFNKDSQDQLLKDVIRWNTSDYINIWVVNEICSNSGCGVAGYAYLPFSHGAPFDGIVIEASYLGSSPANSSVLVHEMGHYLGLYHTFQEGCSNNNCLINGDKVCDTPPDQSTSRVPCPSPTNSCSTDVNSSDSNNPFTTDQNDMINNYMDYSNLECYSAFTLGQKDRMHFAIDNQRYSLVESKACLSPCLNPIGVDISVSNTTINIGESLNFNSVSSGAISFEWLIDGTPFANSQNSNYTFNNEGTFTITLVAYNSDPNCQDIASIEIEVVCPVVAAFVASSTDIKPGGEVIFSNISQNATSYQWLFDGVPVSSNYNFSNVFTIEGNYDIQLIANNGLCSDTSFITVITVSEFGITGTGLPVWPVTATNTNLIETVKWDKADPVVEIISDDGEDYNGQTGVAINACGKLAFYAIHTGSSEPNHLNLYLPDGTELLTNFTSNGPGLNGVKGNNEIQVVRVPTFSNEWYIIYSQWSTDTGAPINNASYREAKILYSRVRLNEKTNLIVLERDVELRAPSVGYTYASGKAVSRTAYGSRDQHFLYACRRVVGSSQASLDRFLITSTGITWDKNTGTVSGSTWFLSLAGSPIELSPTEDRIAVVFRNQSSNQTDVRIFNSDSFSASDHIEISAGELELVADGTSNDLSSELPYTDRIENIANDNSLNLRFLSNYERKLSRIEFSPNGRFLYLNTGGYSQSGTTNLTYLSQIDLEANPLQVRMQIQTTPNDDYSSFSGVGCSTSSTQCLDAYAAVGEIQSCYNGKLYFTKRSDNLFYVIPNPNEVLPQNLVPSDINLETNEDPNIVMNGKTSFMPDQIDGHDYTDERFTNIEFKVNALDCNDDCLAPYPIELYLGATLIESFEANECPDIFEFCGDTTKVYSLYSPLINLTYDSAIVFGAVNYPPNLDYFDFSDLTGCIEICNNGIDDDNDGLIDCDDPDLQDSCCCYLPPTFDLGPDIETCANGVFVLDAGDQFVVYKWSDLSTESTTTVYEPGKYWVEVIDSCGQVQIDSINIIWNPITQINLGEDFSICNGESVDLSLSGFTSYDWYPNEGIDCIDCETISFNPDTSTTYVVVAEKEGCYSVDSINVFVSENSYEIIDTSICSNDFITIGNVNLNVGDSQTFFFINSVGCDSTLEVSVSDSGFPSYIEYIDTLVCENATVNISGIEYNAYSKDTFNLQTVSGCDSTVFINIGGIPSFSTNDTVDICYGETIEIFGNITGVSGNYSNSFTSVDFCDSVHTTTLLVQEEIVPNFETIPTCMDEENGSINLTVSGGVEPYSYQWNVNNLTSNEIQGLSTGEYEVTITDAYNCKITATVTVEALTNIELDIGVQDIICYGEENGMIDLSNNPTGLMYSLDDLNYSANTLYDSLAFGVYTIYATDQYGCKYSSTIEILQEEEIFVQLPKDTIIKFGESIEIIPFTNADGAISYYWEEEDGLDCNDCFSPFAQPVNDMIYTLEIIDENGCIAKDEMLIQIERDDQIYIPNIFSPNGDNVNDYFLPFTGPGVKSILKMNVYDRWGGLMYENSFVDLNQPSKGWNGTCNGKFVNPGVFVYIIELEYIDGSQKIFSGDLTVIR